MHKLLTRESNGLFSPLIDVVLNVLGAVFLLLLLYLYLAPRHRQPLKFLEVAPAPVVRGLNYVFTFPVTGGCGGGRTFILKGELPAGLMFDRQSGTIYGVLLAPGELIEVPFQVEVRDETCVDIREARLRIYPTAIAYDPNRPRFGLSRATRRLPPGRVGVPYEAVIGAIGGAQPYAWSGHDLPPGLELAQGRISGRPESAGNFTIGVGVEFLSGEFRDGQRTLRWVGGTVAGTYDLEILPPLKYEVALPEGRVSEPFVGGILSDAWLDGEVIRWSGSVPGLRVSADGRILSGRPLSAGLFELSFRILRHGTELSKGQGTIRISPQEAGLRIGPAIFQAWEGEPFRSLIPYRGAREPVTIESVGELPAGLQIIDGELRGTPRNPGLTRLHLRIRDILGNAAEGEVIIRVGGRY